MPIKLLRDAKKFHCGAEPLADAIGRSTNRENVPRNHLGIDDGPGCSYVFEFGAQKIRRVSDNALTMTRQALPNADMDQLWANRGSVFGDATERANRPKEFFGNVGFELRPISPG